MPLSSKLQLSGLTWFAAFLRVPALFANHYHADEALFSSWARLIAVWRDPLLSTQLVDKPPLLFYLQALFYPLLGPVEYASRLPNLITSILLVPLTALLAWRLYRNPTTCLFAALVVAISPMAIQYSATAYTDPLLTFLLILALLLITGREKPALSGLVFGLAVATKYQAWLFLPLLFGVAWMHHWQRRQWLRWLAGSLIPLLALIFWEIARTGSPVIWSNQISNFGGLRFVYSWELLPRLQAWTVQWQIVFGSSLLFFLFAICVLGLFLRGIINRSSDLLLLFYFAAYLLAHWLLAVPVWDRYLLPILPLAAVLLARGMTLSINWLNSRPALTLTDKLVPLLMFLALLSFFTVPAVGAARAGQWFTGGQPAADQGAWQIAQYLDGEPYGTVLYDHWYSWHWRYHFFDKAVYVSWFPDPAALAADVEAFGDSAGSRYIVLPDSAASAPVFRALKQAGYELQETFRVDVDPGMILYQVRR